MSQQVSSRVLAPAADPAPPEPEPAPAGPGLVDLDREVALARLFDANHTQLLRLAVLLGAESEAEDIVSEAFYELYRRWRRLRSHDAALSYLRAVVCNLVRMRVRRLQVARKHAEQVIESVGSAEAEVLLRDDQRALVEAIKRLPTRQREALVLRYWLDLRESEIAAAMGISAGAVKSHTSRGMATLSRLLEERR
ncbi:sigma-70 family RNA polymerase sigma factor [Dactylosporangium roseum]|uniref:Sigma-70 family RNA polymerase sigma factor n=1 Tax=Dactylosporangium roseum TaxID=47989 RepID=A0ABY5YX11_9ACTN|nr:sigma-70 family RNA polymerase sigma factor [Dactylosporangium roseum]UWZ34280.1 sigma-70 family RNA polymerase sigma factor [Dactylosporangium roseum]